MCGDRRLNLWIGIVLIVLPILSSCNSLCKNEIITELPSADGKLKAVVFQRDCGATTDYSTQVSILKISDKLANKGGNIFAADSNHGAAPIGEKGGPNVDVAWKGESRLLIKHHPKARLFKSKNKITIGFALFQSANVSVEYNSKQEK
jgi:hypothetical protein